MTEQIESKHSARRWGKRTGYAAAALAVTGAFAGPAVAAPTTATAPAAAAATAPVAKSAFNGVPVEGLLRPARLPLGDAPQVPYVTGSTLIDGDSRIEIALPQDHAVAGFTRWNDGWAAGIENADGGRQVVLVAADGTTRPIFPGTKADAVMSTPDGSRLVVADEKAANGPVVFSVVNTKGKVERRVTLKATYRLRGFVGPRKVLLSGGSEASRTKLLDVRTGKVTALRKGFTYGGGAGYATVGNMRGSDFEPCADVVRVSGRVVGSSCTWAPEVFSPSGRFALAGPTYRDGIGTAELRLVAPATPDKAVVELKVSNRRDPAFFSGSAWEDGKHFLVAVSRYGTTAETTVVRCNTSGACERVTGRISADDEFPRLVFGQQ